VKTNEKVTVKDLSEEAKKDREFTFDHALWSHDGFQIDETGYNYPTNDNYVDQKKVWKMMGERVLEKAWGGLNCTLFAYG